MTTEEFIIKIKKLDLSRAEIATRTQNHRKTIDNWISKGVIPSWVDSWLELYEENMKLKKEAAVNKYKIETVKENLRDSLGILIKEKKR
jgi:predicted DNA-binding protein YlxM (UPF0122 family)